jgi:flagellar assembly factor FliW
MPSIQTRYFGEIAYESEAVVQFPAGLYAFEGHKNFLLIEREATRPFWFLQSLEDPVLTFLTLPAQAIDPAYALTLQDDDAGLLGFATPGSVPSIGHDLLCLFLVTTGEETATANLLAPVVINPVNRKGTQVIQFESGYSHQHPLSSHGERGVENRSTGDSPCC